ncbi:hypothetical protein [Sphingomonas sp. R1]|uniref:hypothetical protein n=1 Tax=Sphingomonas sp. R1 TaxID=399176 RepID=UPI002225483E|nr:hypothetical protein [Sphingomonas sp. R1]UYY77258.1 hypothetical protein OIM94_17465 [Sphingomonas sp. R1]
MGREASTFAVIGAECGTVTVLLEADILVVRGPIRRRYARCDLVDVRAEQGELRFRCGDEAAALSLGEPASSRWVDAIARPLPSLRDKLGLSGLALVLGDCEDAALGAALEGRTTADPAAACMIIARIETEADLDIARTLPGRLPIWTVYRKGKGVCFGDSAIRQSMRAAGYRDSKSCAVSERWTATRYTKAD